MMHMLHHSRFLSAAMIVATLAMGGCSKDDDAPEAPATPNPTPTNNPSPTPNFPDAAGVLWAINTLTSQTVGGIPFEMESGIGVAMFPSEADAAVNVDAGTVSLNGTALTRQSNNTYVSMPTQTEPMGIDLGSGQTHWAVSGGGGVPALDQSPSFTFPTVGDITSSTTITRSNGYTLAVANVSGSDSVVFMVGSIVKMKPSGTTSCTFTAGELGTLTAGASLVQVSPYAYVAQTLSGRQYVFGKQTARSASATIQ